MICMSQFQVSYFEESMWIVNIPRLCFLVLCFVLSRLDTI